MYIWGFIVKKFSAESVQTVEKRRSESVKFGGNLKCICDSQNERFGEMIADYLKTDRQARWIKSAWQ